MAELYREYRFRRMFPTLSVYDEETAKKTDWFLQFEKIDQEVAAKQPPGGTRGN